MPSTTDIGTLTTQASEAAVQIAGRTTNGLGVVDTADGLVYDPDPWVYPTAVDDGWDVSGTCAALVRVSPAENKIARTAYLVIDPDNAPLTGNYVLKIGGETVTYDATSGAPADVDALLTAWRDAIWAALGVGGSGTDRFSAVTVVSFRANGTNDGIRLVALDANPTRSTFAIEADTAAPTLADLYVFREPEAVTAEVFVRTSATPPTSGDNAGTLRQRQGWDQPGGGSIGALGPKGWADWLNVGGIDRLHVLLSGATYGSDTVATSAGVVTVMPLVTVCVEPASA